MNPSRLNEKYPWVTYDLSNFDNPEAYGGWYGIMDSLLASIAQRYAKEGIPLNEDTFALRQVKEKFAGLRFYASSRVDIEDLRHAAEKVAMKTCMTCGAPGEVVVTRWWYHTVCPKHRKPGDVTPEEHNKRCEEHRAKILSKREKK